MWIKQNAFCIYNFLNYDHYNYIAFKMIIWSNKAFYNLSYGIAFEINQIFYIYNGHINSEIDTKLFSTFNPLYINLNEYLINLHTNNHCYLKSFTRLRLDINY